jgi:hypothetical protein
MLMGPLDPVVGSIARVLKPGGIFAALVGGDMVRGDAWEAFTDAAKSLLAEEGALPPSLGDSRTRTMSTKFPCADSTLSRASRLCPPSLLAK